MNITDVGHMTDEVSDTGRDKMELAEADEGLSPPRRSPRSTRTRSWTTPTWSASSGPTSVPKATEHIPEMIKLTERLIEKGHAYEVDGTVYYDVRSFPGYGKLSGNTLDQLRAGHRQELAVDPNKRHPEDFALWKKAGPNRLMKWASPWGEGFPGWHIECSAMSMKYLGERFDIHTGGNDNKFPHHEDEIAQSEGAVGHQVDLDVGARRVPAAERAEDGQVRGQHHPDRGPRGASDRSARPSATSRSGPGTAGRWTSPRRRSGPPTRRSSACGNGWRLGRPRRGR